jgi:hypothetical protein
MSLIFLGMGVTGYILYTVYTTLSQPSFTGNGGNIPKFGFKAITELLLIVLEFYKRRYVFRFVWILCTVLYSTLLHLPPLRFQRVRGWYMGLNPRLFRLWHWQSDAISHPLSTISHPLIKILKVFEGRREMVKLVCGCGVAQMDAA